MDGCCNKGARAVSCGQENSGGKSESRAILIKRNPLFGGKEVRYQEQGRGRRRRGGGKKKRRLTVCERPGAAFSKAECGVGLFFYCSLTVFPVFVLFLSPDQLILVCSCSRYG